MSGPRRIRSIRPTRVFPSAQTFMPARPDRVKLVILPPMVRLVLVRVMVMTLMLRLVLPKQFPPPVMHMLTRPALGV